MTGNSSAQVRTGHREFQPLHGVNPSYVTVIQVLSSVLLTLLGATIASQLSRKPSDR